MVLVVWCFLSYATSSLFGKSRESRTAGTPGISTVLPAVRETLNAGALLILSATA